MRPLVAPALLTVWLAVLTGCVTDLITSVQTSPCLNPADLCDEDGSNSKVLDVYVYQLTKPIPNAGALQAELRDPSIVL